MQRFTERLRARFPDRDGQFNSVEAMVGDWEERFHRGQTLARAEHRLFLVTHQNTASRLIALVGTSVAARAVSLGNGLVLLLNRTQTHGAFAVARAFFETAAVPCYMRRQVAPRVAKGRATASKELLMRLGLGVDPGLAIGRFAPIRVSAFVNALAQDAHALAESFPDQPRRVNPVQEAYSVLTDHTHPNFSAMTHGSDLTYDEGQTWVLQPPVTADILGDIVPAVGLAASLGGQALDAMLDAAEQRHLVLPDD